MIEKNLTHTERIARGQRVKALVGDEIFADIMARLHERGMEAFRAATTNDARTNVWALLNGLEEIKKQLLVEVEDGELALAERQRAESRPAQ